jgi:hypothetical protein
VERTGTETEYTQSRTRIPSRHWPFPRQVDHDRRPETHGGTVNGRVGGESLEDREWTDSGEILEL